MVERARFSPKVAGLLNKSPQAKQKSELHPAFHAPSAYQPEFGPLVRKLRMLNLTLMQIADVFEVSDTTIKNWRLSYPAFAKHWDEGGVAADGDVAHAFYKRATGYSHKAVKIQFDREGNEMRAEYTQHYPPDTAAAMFWLMNRQPDLWKARNTNTQAPGESAGEVVVRILGGLPERKPAPAEEQTADPKSLNDFINKRTLPPRRKDV